MFTRGVTQNAPVWIRSKKQTSFYFLFFYLLVQVNELNCVVSSLQVAEFETTSTTHHYMFTFLLYSI